MLQILGLRDHTFTDKKTNKPVTRKREVFFEKGWRLEKIQDVFNAEILYKLISSIPQDERWNLYFTLADCFEESGRKLKEQWAIPFDIDGLDLPETYTPEECRAEAEKVARAACQAIGVSFNDCLVSFSGNGVQIFVVLETPITDENYFDNARAAYGVIAQKIQGELNAKGIQGKIDPSVWSTGRLMRLPNTTNKKPNKPTRESFILNGTAKPIAYDVVNQSGVALVNKGEFVPDDVLKNYPKPDTKAILEGCEFLKYCDQNAETLPEPLWYAENSIVARLEDGEAMVHERSSRHPLYNAYETDHKIEQAMHAAGPRTCKDIDARWGNCSKCPHFGKITSPIMIKGPDYIGSSDFGFRERKVTKSGVVPGRVLFSDLKLQFSVDHIYKVVKDTDQIIVYKDTHWEYMNDRELKTWCMGKVNPEPSVQDMNEFVGQIKSHNLTSLEGLDKTRQGHINFQNCVLNIHTGKVHQSSPDFGFFDVRPYNYNANAKAPVFEKFVLDIMSGSEEKAQLLKEYAGYCISGDYPWLQKAMLLVGDGSNGKSLFVDTLGEVVGESAHTAVPIQELSSHTMRYSLVNKLFNFSEETSVRAFGDGSTFKNIVSGGLLTVKQLYIQPHVARISAKLLIACNDIPSTLDSTHGFIRRLVILMFNELYTPGDGRFDGDLKNKLRQEIPGICNSILKAYKECIARGYLLHVDEVKKVVDEYAEENNSVLHFVREVLVEDPLGEIKVADAYEEYKIMCERDTIKPKTASWFGRDLAKIMKKPAKTTSRLGKSVRVIEGFKINKDY